MYWYTRHYAKLIHSSAFLADAWHHRSDAFSSIGSLIGIGGAMLGFPVMDSVASVAICLFIVKASYDILKDAVVKLLASTPNSLPRCRCWRRTTYPAAQRAVRGPRGHPAPHF